MHLDTDQVAFFTFSNIWIGNYLVCLILNGQLQGLRIPLIPILAELSTAKSRPTCSAKGPRAEIGCR